MKADIFIVGESPKFALNIHEKSAIVGIKTESGYMIYYEGNIYGAVNLERWNERVRVAAGRLFERYPTVARMFIVDPSEYGLECVGEVSRDEQKHLALGIEPEKLQKVAQFAEEDEDEIVDWRVEGAQSGMIFCGDRESAQKLYEYIKSAGDTRMLTRGFGLKKPMIRGESVCLTRNAEQYNLDQSRIASLRHL